MKRYISLILIFAMVAAFSAYGQLADTEALASQGVGQIYGAALSMQSGQTKAANAINASADYTPVFPSHKPYGAGVGAMPGRVVWEHDPDSVEWDGQGYWWELGHFDEAVIQNMVGSGIASLAGEEDVGSGWSVLFRAHNATRGGTGGYERGQKIAIKTNMNGAGAYGDDTSGASQESYTNPVLLKALLISLVTDAGVAPADITVFDAGRVIPDYMQKLCSEGILNGVQFRYRDLLGKNDAQANRNVPVAWSQQVSGETNYLPTCVTEADYLINLANLKGHVYGVTLSAKNHYGTIMNSNRMRAPEAAGVHRYLTQNRMAAYTVLVDLMANYQIGEKTMLYLLDAIICAPGESISITGDNSRWQQTPFNGDYTSSVFFSQDPVAIDSVGADFLMNEPTVTSRNSTLRDNPNVENYLHEAALAANAPSGTVYLNGNGERVKNLGVHEHWNNPVNKQYSRDLGGGEGIELVRPGVNSENAPEPDTPDTTFTDVPAGAWYHEAVEYCKRSRLMSGTSAGTFAPNTTASRAMLVEILYRQAGSPPVQPHAGFPDVPAGAWYRDAVVWAAVNGTVSGYGGGRFGPGDPVTREQFATILWRMESSPDPTGSFAPFADQSVITAYALDAVAWARENRITSGKDGNLFDPHGLVTRAEMAAMLYRYLSR